jgi:hypothetical protein
MKLCFVLGQLAPVPQNLPTRWRGQAAQSAQQTGLASPVAPLNPNKGAAQGFD